MSFSINAIGTKAGVAALVKAASVNGQQLGEVARTAILAALDQIATNGVEVMCSGHQDAAYGNVAIQVSGKVFQLDPVDAAAAEPPVEAGAPEVVSAAG